jgi:diguanylate cyclase (GGDEF)-like protein
MSSNDLVTLLFVLVAANVVLILVAILMSQVRRRRATEAAAAAAAARTNGHSNGHSNGTTPSAGRGYLGAGSPGPEQPARLTDPLTGLLSTSDWNRLVADEDVRMGRYRRPATIILIELDGLDRLVGAVGQPAADRVLAAVADTIRSHARKVDQIGRLGPSRFGVLQPETNEVTAINYVERVRRASDLWLESGAISLRLAIGWASPVGDASLIDAQAQALERMFLEVHRTSLRNDDPEAGPSSPMPGGMEGAPAV